MASAVSVRCHILSWSASQRDGYRGHRLPLSGLGASRHLRCAGATPPRSGPSIINAMVVIRRVQCRFAYIALPRRSIDGYFHPSPPPASAPGWNRLARRVSLDLDHRSFAAHAYVPTLRPRHITMPGRGPSREQYNNCCCVRHTSPYTVSSIIIESSCRPLIILSLRLRQGPSASASVPPCVALFQSPSPRPPIRHSVKAKALADNGGSARP